MLTNQPEQFIQDFITEIDAALVELKLNAKRTKAKKIKKVTTYIERV